MNENERNLFELARRLVGEHVLANQHLLVDKLFKLDAIDWEQIENLTYYEVDKVDGKETAICTQSELDQLIGNVEFGLGHAGDDDEYEALTERLDYLKSLEPREWEVYEWWLCSPDLTKELSARNEVILSTDYETWWGRCCTGQAIALDPQIQEIAEKWYGKRERY